MSEHFCCPYCEACFDNAGEEFALHVMQKHVSLDYPTNFYCSICQKKFVQVLWVHVKINHHSKCILCMQPITYWEHNFSDFIHRQCCSFIKEQSNLKIICDFFSERAEYLYNYKQI